MWITGSTTTTTNQMMKRSRLRLVLTTITCFFLALPLDGFVIKKRFANNGDLNYNNYKGNNNNNDIENLNDNIYELNYDDDDDDGDDDSFVHRNEINDEEPEEASKRDFSSERLKERVRNEMERLISGKDETPLLFKNEMLENEENRLNHLFENLIKDGDEEAVSLGKFPSVQKFVEEKSSESKIETNGNKGLAIVAGRTIQSSGNGSSPVVKVAKVVAVATKEGSNDKNGGWKMKPIEEEVKVITPSPVMGKEERVESSDEIDEPFGSKQTDDAKHLLNFGDNDGDDDDDRDDGRGGDDNDGIKGKGLRRRKRSLDYEEALDDDVRHENKDSRFKKLSKKKNEHEEDDDDDDVDMVKNYIALQDAENRHLMQALDLASEIEFKQREGVGDSETIDEQMYHMRKALEEEKSLGVIRKQMRVSSHSEESKRSPYLDNVSNLNKIDYERIIGRQKMNDDDQFLDESPEIGSQNFIKTGEDDEDIGAERRRSNERDDGDDEEEEEERLLESFADDSALSRHKLKTEDDDLIDRLTQAVDDSDGGWMEDNGKEQMRRRPRLFSEEEDENEIDEETLRHLLKNYRTHSRRSFNEDSLTNSDLSDEEEEEDDEDDRRKLLEEVGMKLNPAEYHLNPFYKKIMAVENSVKRNFAEREDSLEELLSPMSPDEAVDNTEPWCRSASKMVDNCLYARLNGLLPDSEAVDLCNAHQLCYKCGSTYGATAEQCNSAFMERSKELCSDEMGCKKQAASLFITMMGDRQFLPAMQAPQTCSQTCVAEILAGGIDR